MKVTKNGGVQDESIGIEKTRASLPFRRCAGMVNPAATQYMPTTCRVHFHGQAAVPRRRVQLSVMLLLLKRDRIKHFH
jgi:hypothetical protein